MSNLLDKASVILTPTAYNNGEALCVKPSDGSGDFDFSRNSAATRVNAQGLVENVQILSSNLVQNPSFSEEGVQEVSNGSFSQEGSQLITNGNFDTDSDWVKTGSIEIANGQAIATNASTEYLYQSTSLVVGKFYKITFTVSDYISGIVRSGLNDGLNNSGANRTANGTYTDYIKFTVGNTFVGVLFTNNASMSITNVSCVEVGQDWVIENTWTIGDGVANGNGANGFSEELLQGSILTVGKIYSITYEIKNYVSGSIKTRKPNTSSVSEDGVYTEIAEATSSSLIFTGTNFIGSITNISVKEVGMDWTLGTGWSIGDDKAISNGSGFGALSSSYSNFNNKKLKVNFDILNYVSGEIRVPPSYRQDGLDIRYSANGSYELIYDSINSDFALNTVNFNGSVTNISVLEITDDTNLPRISYENFSYQDALGSELITNGDFNDGFTNWITFRTTSVSNGVATIGPTSSQSGIYQGILSQNKSYKVTINVTAYNGIGQAQVTDDSGSVLYTITDVGEQSFIFEHTIPQLNLIIRGLSNALLSIDNVSVKEYLGQSVVPNSGCGSWLFEPQSTNLITYSEDFSQNSSWNKVGASVTSGFVSPDGTLNAFKMTETTSTGGHYASTSNIGVTLGDDTTFSVFIKKGESNFIQLLFSGASHSSTNYANFDLLNGVLGSVGAGVAKIESIGGFYRCSFTSQATSTTATKGYIWKIQSLTSSRAESYTGDGTSGVYIFGAQLEQQSYATSYIPTNGEPNGVTRNQDLCNNGATGTGLINSTEGVLYAEIAALTNAGGGTRRIEITNNGRTQYVRLQIANGDGTLYAIVNDGSQQFLFNYTSFIANQNNKIGLKFAQNNFALWVNGIEVGSSNTGNTFATGVLNQIDFGSGSYFFGKTKALAVWKEALSDQELADLTYPTPTDPTFTLDFDTIAEQFTFARGSEATYVDAQGLIQSTNELGSELILNGGFATDSDWTKEVGWNISNGSLNASATTNQAYQLNTGIVTNKTYKVTYTISNYVSGSVRIELGGFNVSVGAERSANGTYTEYIVALGNDAILFDGIISFTGSIDNVSVKEVITATNTPRLDYSTGAEAFLLEPQSTNLITQSELFSDASWLRVGSITTTDNYTTSPSGQNNATRLQWTNATNYIYQSLSHVGNDFTLSIYLKSNTDVSQQVRLFMDNGAQAQDVLVTTQWQRFEFTNTTTPTQSNRNVGLIKSGGQVGDLDISIWGAQFEAQSYATSYIPSNGSQTTRNQETCINATPEINSEEGVLYAEIASLTSDVSGDNRIVLAKSGDTNNVIRLNYNTTSNTIQYKVRVASSNVCDLTYDLGNSTAFHKICCRWKQNDFALWVDGVEVATDTSGAVFPNGTLNTLTFSNAIADSDFFFGNTKNLQVYTKALSDAELINLTTI